MEECPICGEKFAPQVLQQHVNACLDSQESRPKRQKKDDAESKKSQAFAALGLKMDSVESRKPKAKKPRLASMLLAERRKASTQVSESSPSNSQEKDTSVSQPVRPAPPKETRDQELARLARESKLPLAQRLRPRSMDDFFGQEKLVGEDGMLRNLITSQHIPSFILWGVPGVGKTSLARIIANNTNNRFVELSVPNTTATKLREVFQAADNDRRLMGRKTVVFLDEIHRFNKSQQDILLPVIEKGTVTVIGATTENPSFTLTNALLSRMHTFVMEPLSHRAIVKILNRGLFTVNQTRRLINNLHLISLSKEAIDYVADLSSGDSRVALNILESIHAYLSGVKYKTITPAEPAEKDIKVPENLGVIKIDKEQLKPLLSTRNYQMMYDHHGDSHYDTISAFHKSVRGCNADAAIFYLTKMLVGGEDPLFIIRRMIVIASEDIGLRDSSCLPFVIAAKEAFEFVGMPEGRIILAHCAVKLARAPKSTKSYRALSNATKFFKEHPDAPSYKIPMHLRNAPTRLMSEMGYGDSYRYNPSFENGVVKQTYLPEEAKDEVFVEETHLGVQRDRLVPSEEYSKVNRELKEYENFKKQRKQLKKDMLQEAVSFAKEGSSMSLSYDEFLTKDEQSEYYDGEAEASGEESDSQNNFEKSYDEFLPEEEKVNYVLGAE